MGEDEEYYRPPLIKEEEGEGISFSDEFKGIILDKKGKIVGCLLSDVKHIHILSFEGEGSNIPLVLLNKKTQEIRLGKEQIEEENPTKEIGKIFIQTMMDRTGIVKRLLDNSPKTLTRILGFGKKLERNNIDTEKAVEIIREKKEEDSQND